MSPLSRFIVCRFGCPATAIAMVLYSAIAANAQSANSSDQAVVGRVDFEAANLPPATVEVELGPGMIGDLLGLGKAAIGGVAETLIASPEGSETTKLAADQLVAVQEVVQLASEVVQEVRVRVYEDGPAPLNGQFTSQLKSGDWNRIVRVHDGNESVQVSLVRQEGAIRGIFVVGADNNDLVLVNVVCNVSPEKVKSLTAKAAQIGLDNGLQQVIESKLKHLRRHHGHDHSQAAHQEQARR